MRSSERETSETRWDGKETCFSRNNVKVVGYQLVGAVSVCHVFLRCNPAKGYSIDRRRHYFQAISGASCTRILLAARRFEQLFNSSRRARLQFIAWLSCFRHALLQAASNPRARATQDENCWVKCRTRYSQKQELLQSPVRSSACSSMPMQPLSQQHHRERLSCSIFIRALVIGCVAALNIAGAGQSILGTLQPRTRLVKLRRQDERFVTRTWACVTSARVVRECGFSMAQCY